MTAPGPPLDPREPVVRRLSPWRAWIGRLAIAAAAVLVLATGVTFWLFDRASQGRLTVRLLEIGNRELSRSSNLRVYAARLRVRGSTVDLDTLQVDAQEGGKWYRLLDAVHARVRGDVRSLAFGKPQIFDVQLTSPVFHVVTAQDGRTVIPQFRSSGKKGGGGLKDGFHVALERARLRAHVRGDSIEWWEDGTLDVRLHPEAGGFDVTLDRGSGRLPTLGLQVHAAAGHAWAIADTLRLSDFLARTDAGAARLSGTLAHRTLTGQFRADQWPWEFFGDLLEQPALDVPGEVSVRGSVLGTVDRPEFRTLLTGHWREEPFEGVIDGRIIKTGFAVSRADMAWRRARFTGAAEFPRAGRWSIAGRVSDLDLSQVVHLFPGAVLPQSELDGPARIEGSEGTLLITSTGLSGVLMDLPLGGVKGSWRVLGRRHRVEAGGTVAGGALALQGGWDDRTVALEGTATHADLSRFGTWIPALRGARGELEETRYTVIGPVRSPRLTLDGRVAGASFPPVDAEAVRFHYIGVWSKSPEGSGTIEAQGLSAHGWQADSAWVVVRHVGRDILVAPLVAERGDTTLYVAAEIRPEGDGWQVRADSLHLESERGWVSAVGPVELVSRRGEWFVRNATLDGSGGRLAVTGRARNEDDMDLRITGRGIVAGQLAETVGLHGWSGDLGFDAHLVAGGGKRALDFDATATQLVTPTFQVPQGSASVRLTESGGHLDVERLHLELGESVLDGSGQARLAEGKWPLDPSRWMAELRRTREWRGEVSLRNFDLTELSAVWPRLDWLSGHVTGTARLGGRPSEPEGETQGTVADLFIRGHPIDHVTWRARYGGSTLSIEDLRIGQGDSSAVIRGTLPLDLSWGGEGHDQRVPDRPMDLRIQAQRVSLGEVATFLPFVAYADGALTADLRVLGTPRRMRPTGTLDVSGARLRFTGREEVYRDVEGQLVFDSTTVRVARLQATQGKDGTVSGSGTVTLGPNGVEDYDLQVKAVNALALASGEYEAHFDGDFKVDAGPRLGKSWFPLPHASGKLTVRDGVILYDFADPANRVYFAGPRQAPAWVYDVDVTAPSRMYWRTPNANVELKTDLTVSRTLDDFRVWGSVESLRGSYYFLENKFTVDNGTLEFDQVEPMNPRVDATAHTDISTGSRGETVTITLSGRVREPTLQLTSSNALSQQEIVRTLAGARFGWDPNQPLAEGQTGIAAGTTGGQYLLRQLTQQFPEVSPLLGDVEFGQRIVETSEGGKIVPIIGIGRYVTPEFRVRYSQALGTPSSATTGVNVRDLGAEYRINRIFFLTGEILERRFGGSSLSPAGSQSELEYNLDLRARYEY